MNYQSFYIGRILNAISQLGNALIGGDSDVSISARIGYNTYFPKVAKFYKVCEWIVDKTFYPVDGVGHCRNAYLRDRREDFSIGQGDFVGEVVMSVLIVLFCIPLAALFWLYYLIVKIAEK